MFINCLKTEVKKALFNKMMFVICLFVMSLAVYNAVTAIIFYNDFYTCYQSDDLTGNPMITIVSLYHRWMGADVISFTSSGFFFLFPIIVVLPYGWSMVGEMKSGYTKNVLSRIGRKDYFLAKYAACFISGSLIIIIPLLSNFLGLALFLPAIKMEKIYPYGSVGESCMWSGLYYEHPFLYMIIYILLDGIYGGLIASITSAIAFFIRNRIAVMLIPFFLMLLMDYIDGAFLVNGEYSPIKFLQAVPVANDRYGPAIFMIGLIIFLSTLGITVYKERKYEVL